MKYFDRVFFGLIFLGVLSPMVAITAGAGGYDFPHRLIAGCLSFIVAATATVVFTKIIK